MALLPVADALAKVLTSVSELGHEVINIHSASGRITSANIFAKITQPPFAASAMDGYAVRFKDIKKSLIVVGESQAGLSYSGSISEGEALRIFTGAPLVNGADTVVIQENISLKNNNITINFPLEKGSNIRAIGSDFMNGELLVAKNTKLNARHIGLLAAGNIFELKVYKKPRIAILSTGDELVEVGSPVGLNKIVNSNLPMFMALIYEIGAIPINIGNALDTPESVSSKIDQIKDVDIFVSIGGASVGDYDIIQDVMKTKGLKVHFWKVGMQPGKPLIYGKFNDISYFGLPGNPTSAHVCFINFIIPAIYKMMGRSEGGLKISHAYLEHDLSKGGSRVNYIRAALHENEFGKKFINSSFTQSSANHKTLANSNCLIVRDINASPAKAGDLVKVILIDIH